MKPSHKCYEKTGRTHSIRVLVRSYTMRWLDPLVLRVILNIGLRFHQGTKVSSQNATVVESQSLK